jgi:hypothetical protein
MQVIHNVRHVCCAHSGHRKDWRPAQPVSFRDKRSGEVGNLHSMRGSCAATMVGVPEDHCEPSLRTQILRKLIGGEGSPCACSLMGASG